MNIFVDTGAFYALADTSDARHDSAKNFYTAAIREHRFFTTNFALVETWLLIRNKLGYNAAQKFFDRIRKGIVGVMDVPASDLEKAWMILTEYADQEFSLVDAASFAVIERLRISTAFSFDAHFRMYRFGKGTGIALVPQ